MPSRAAARVILVQEEAVQPVRGDNSFPRANPIWLTASANTFVHAALS